MPVKLPVYIVIVERMRHCAIDECGIMKARPLPACYERTRPLCFAAKFFKQKPDKRFADTGNGAPEPVQQHMFCALECGIRDIFRAQARHP